MKILVTGAYGQLGNELNDLSSDFGDWDFVFTDVDSLDITRQEDVETFFNREKPEFVVNCAAYTAVDKAETEPEKARLLNAVAPSFLARAARVNGARMIQISTDYVFDGAANTPYAEEDMENPQGIYGKTKREGEKLSMEINPATLIIRTSWLYSSYGSNFVKTMLRLGNERDLLKVVFDQTGTPTYAADLARAIFSVIEDWGNGAGPDRSGIFHYSNEGVLSWYDFAKTIFEISGINCNVLPVLSEEFPTPAKRPHYSVLNKRKMRNTFHLDIPYWKDSLKVCLTKIQKTV